MIVPMKKVTVIVQKQDARTAVESMRSLGVLHVEHEIAPAGKDINDLEQDLALLDRAIAILSDSEFSAKKAVADKKLNDWKVSARHILDLRSRYEQLQKYSSVLKKDISAWQAWGDFNPQTVQYLAKRNIHIRFYQIPLSEIKDLPDEVIVRKISARAGIANCAVITQKKIEISFPELSLPKMGLARLKARLAEDIRVAQTIKEQIKQHLVYRESFLAAKKLLENELELHQARRGMGQSGNFMYLTGYAPFDAAKSLLETAKKEKWGILVRDPTQEDSVPTLIRNPRWISVINPVFKIINVVPGYNELDISLWFLLFFSIFFAMLIGDAGYGMIFLCGTFFAQRKWGARLNDKSVFILFYILSLCTIIWGALTGTFFGQGWLPQSVKPLLPALRNSRTIQALCFLLGAIHLSIAHFWRALIKFPSPRALAEAGWIAILWSAYFLARTLILGNSFPVAAKLLIIAGIILVVFFTQPQKNIIKGIGVGIGNLLLNLINNFTDIVSYIRLFAVGLATVAVADAFNMMAMDVGFSNIFTGFVTMLILIFGHALNILLGPMAVLVHGVRLNVLEFSNHIDVRWSGFAYRPLKS